jgi:hypothetical protein
MVDISYFSKWMHCSRCGSGDNVKRTTEQQRVVSGIGQGLQEAVAYARGDAEGARVTVMEMERSDHDAETRNTKSSRLKEP